MNDPRTANIHRTRPKKRSGAWLFTAASMLVAGLVGLLVFQTIEDTHPTKVYAIVRVLVAAHDIPLGKTLTAEDVTLIDWPQENAIFRASSTPEEIIGRVATRAMVQGETISTQRLAPREAGQGLVALIPKGMRALGLRVNEESGVAGFLHPGDFVDVVTILRDNETDELISKTPLQNIMILAVGDKYQQDPERGEVVNKALVVTVLLSPEQARVLASATVNGQVLLTLRNGYDTEQVATVTLPKETPELALIEETSAPVAHQKNPKSRITQTPIPEEPPTPPVIEEPGLPQVIVGGKIVQHGGGTKKKNKTIPVQ
jgi:pilus assembly protein CpaB